MSCTSVGMEDLSDEILLCILRHLPLSDLLMNVAQVSHKFHTLCHDKTLLANVRLSEDYMVNNIFFKSSCKLFLCKYLFMLKFKHVQGTLYVLKTLFAIFLLLMKMLQ